MEASQPTGGCVLAAVFPGQSPAVAARAATLAAALERELVCAFVNPGRYRVGEAADGSVASASVDPDFFDDAESTFPADLTSSLASLLGPLHVRWRTLLLAGDVADALAHCANTVDAELIVVGTHGDAHTGMRELFNRSVATRLVRQQLRPVVVVPTHHGRAVGEISGTGRR